MFLLFLNLKKSWWHFKIVFVTWAYDQRMQRSNQGLHLVGGAACYVVQDGVHYQLWRVALQNNIFIAK